MQLKSFHFSVGDSFNGPIGMCLRVQAETREEAVRIANEQLAGYPDYEFPNHTLTDGVEYCNIYFNSLGGLTLNDIDEEDDIKDLNTAEKLERRARYSDPVIRARFYSDDLHVDIAFDANRWFGDASDDEIIALASVDWGTHERADQIAFFMESIDLRIEQALVYVKLANIGFEVKVRTDDAKQWVAIHRPNLLKLWD